MQNKLLLSFCSFLLLCPFFVDATHDVGIEMHYECINNCTVRVFHSQYIHCSSSSGTNPGATVLNPVGSVGCGTATPVNSWTFEFEYETTPVCPGMLTDCNGPVLGFSGYKKVVFSRDYDICGTSCQGFAIDWTSCCRSASANTTSAGWHLDGGYIDLSQPQCNNSPKFLLPMNIYPAMGDVSTFSFAAFDPDGDSLAYFLDSCYVSPGQAVIYSNGYSPLQPFGAGWSFSMDPLSGILMMDPSNGGSGGIFYFSVLVKEYRNGIQIGFIKREVESYVSGGGNMMPVSALTNVSGGTLSGPFTIDACAGQVCFDMVGMDPDSGQSVRISWDRAFSGPVFSDVISGNPTDTVSGIAPTARFCWTPPGPGTYRFTYKVMDDYCPVFGENNYGVTINVGTGPVFQVQAAPDSCGKYTFSASPFCGQFSSWLWSGDDGLASTDSSFSHLYLAPGTYAYSMVGTDTAGNVVTYSDSVMVAGVTASAQVNLDSCLTINYNATANGIGLAYTWTGDAGLSGAAPSLVYTYASGGSYAYSLLVSDGLGCVAQVGGTVLVPDVPNPVITEYGDSLVSNYSLSNQWIFNGAPISGANAPYWIALQSGDYAVMVWDTLGCEVTSDTVSVLLSGIEGSLAEVGFGIFPNPGTGVFFFDWGIGSWGEVKLELIDVSGKLVWRGKPIGDRIDLSGYKSGIYFLKVIKGGEVFRRKIVKL